MAAVWLFIYIVFTVGLCLQAYTYGCSCV